MRTFLDLLKQALPPNLSLEGLMAYAPQSWWQNNERAACAHALRNHPEISWQGYLARNPDVAQSGVDPCRHFLQHGIFEGRKLVYNCNWNISVSKDNIDISIIIINRSNDISLARCIKNVQSQKNVSIEIIILNMCVNNTEQFHLLSHNVNLRNIKANVADGELYAIDQAVKVARGRWLAIFHRGCQLIPQAFERVLGYEAYGAGIIAFGALVPANAHDSLEQALPWERPCGAERIIEISSGMLPKALYKDKTVDALLETKLIRKDVWQKSTWGLNLCTLNALGGAYAMPLLVQHCRSMVYLPEKIVSYDPYVCPASQTWMLRQMHIGVQLQQIYKLTEYAASNLIFSYIEHPLFEDIVRQLETVVPDDMVNEWVRELKIRVETSRIISIIASKRLTSYQKILSKLSFYIPVVRNVCIIGIFFHTIIGGGTETVITSMCSSLRELGYKVVLFLEEIEDIPNSISDNVKICRLPSSVHYSSENITAHVGEFNRLLIEYNIDTVIYQASLSYSLVWDLLLCRLLDINFVIHSHTCFSFKYLCEPNFYTPALMNAVYTMADNVFCLSPYSELYYRSIGVDAACLPNPIDMERYRDCHAVHSRRIAVIGRFGDALKQINEALSIIAELKTNWPEVECVFIGSFRTEEQLDAFFNEASRLNVLDSIRLTGWLRDIRPMLQTCGVLLSTSRSEGFGLGIAEAMAMGIPCVAYELSTLLTKNNPGIIGVPQMDVKAAASAINALFADPVRWHVLSQSAKETAARFSPANFRELLGKLLTNLGKSSDLHEYDVSDYKMVSHLLSENTQAARLDRIRE